MNVEATEYFPNTIGDYWEYDVYDSSQIRKYPTLERKYSVKVSVIGKSQLVDGVDAMVWQYEFPWGKEIKYFRNSQDTIKVYDSIYSTTSESLQFPRVLFIKPFHLNQEWSGKLLWVDSFFVSKDNGSSFTNSLLISRKYAGPESYNFSTYSFTEKIGFSQIHIFEIDQGIRKIELWKLKHYELK